MKERRDRLAYFHALGLIQIMWAEYKGFKDPISVNFLKLMKMTMKTYRNWLGKQFFLCFHISQRRPRFLKLGLKGLSDYHSSEIAVEAARRGPMIQIKKATLTEYLFKKESWTTQL